MKPCKIIIKAICDVISVREPEKINGGHWRMPNICKGGVPVISSTFSGEEY